MCSIKIRNLEMKRPAKGRVASGAARGVRRRAQHRGGLLDYFASGWWFDGWRERLAINGLAGVERPVVRARTWLLQVGWRRPGLLVPEEVPRG